ncbi:MAG: hypothetical protein JW705_06160, partial [Methanosarcinaceae archaeon]|nr:hypothetical protein [Methanosarcinaceae archaeon]
MENEKDNISKQEVQELLHTGDELLDILEQNYTWESKEYAKNRSLFVSGYTKWYKRSLTVIRKLRPDRANRFQNLFSTNKRSSVNEYTYTVQDYIHGTYLDNEPRNHTDEVTSRRLKEQMEILRSASTRINEFTFVFEQFVKINPIYSSQESPAENDTKKLLQVNFEDEHYNSLKTEINSTFRLGLFISTFLLSRELIENILIDIMRLIFPPASDENISIYFDIDSQSFKDLNLLLDTVIKIKEELPFDNSAVDEIISSLENMRFKDRPASHSRLRTPNREDILAYRINENVEKLLKMKMSLM